MVGGLRSYFYWVPLDRRDNYGCSPAHCPEADIITARTIAYDAPKLHRIDNRPTTDSAKRLAAKLRINALD